MARTGSHGREQLELGTPCLSPHGGPASGGRMLILTGGDIFPPSLPSMNIQTTHRLTDCGYAKPQPSGRETQLSSPPYSRTQP